MISLDARRTAAKFSQISPIQSARGLRMKKDRRWLKTAIAASTEALPVLPWQRQARRRPQGQKRVATPAKPAGVAAR
jgi:hypothetical protein